MEEECVGKFGGIVANSTRTSAAAIVTIIPNTLKYSDANDNIILFEKQRNVINNQYHQYNVKNSEVQKEKFRKPSTSQNSMSSLLQEEFGTNSRHNFAESLEDETTTSGVLETFEISSSNSLLTSSTATTNESTDSVALHNDDSSSSDALHIIQVTTNGMSSKEKRCPNANYCNSDVFIINDDNSIDNDENVDNVDVGDEDDDESDNTGIIEDNDQVHEQENEEKDRRLAEKLNNTITSSNIENKDITTLSSGVFTHRPTDKVNGIIMGANGSIIYLETPSLEEQQEEQHQDHSVQQIADTDMGDALKTQQPICLNSKFCKDNNLGDEEEGPSSSCATETELCKKILNCNNENKALPTNEMSKKSQQKCSVSITHECIKNTYLDNCAQKPKSLQDMPSSSAKVMSLFSMLDIESMDLIERRDYEHEQSITGGIILKSSSLFKNDMLNLDFVRNKINSTTNEDENESNSCNNNSNIINNISRPYSSDTKCAHKEFTTTPTSSRNHSIRLTKSTAKINLSISLSHNNSLKSSVQQYHPKHILQRSNVLNIPKLNTLQNHDLNVMSGNSLTSTTSLTSSSSSLSLVDKGCSSNSPRSMSCKSVIGEAASNSSLDNVMGVPADIHSNSNSNDSFACSTTSTESSTISSSTVAAASTERRLDLINEITDNNELPQKHSNIVNVASIPSSSVVTVRNLDSDCSCTADVQSIEASINISANSTSPSAAMIEVQDDDVQPSTSSARCQYAPLARTQRQVNASAQTTERYLPRSDSISNSEHSISPGIGMRCISTVSGANLTMSSLAINQRSRNRRLDILSQQQHQQLQSRYLRNNSHEELDHIRVLTDHPLLVKHLDFNDEQEWTDYEENNSDIEEVCTCQHAAIDSSRSSSLSNLNEVVDDAEGSTALCDGHNVSATGGDSGKDANGDLSNYIINNLSISEEGSSSSEFLSTRKRKHNDSRLLDHDYNSPVLLLSGHSSNGDNGDCGTIDAANCRKRIAYDFASTTQKPSSGTVINNQSITTTPTTSTHAVQHFSNIVVTGQSPIGRRTPRSLIPSRENPPPELQQWISQFRNWSHAERIVAMDRLIELCEPTQVRHMMKVIEPQFQRDFISLLPRELALQVLSYLEPRDLLKAAQTCRSWRFLCDDNLLWKDKCRQAQILVEPRGDRPKRGRAGNMPPIASPWKAAYMRQHIIELNWRSRPVREPKVLKGHDEHVITCLQFSGNRIVSGSDDNTLKVWSAVTGRCLRTLVGHTGGVWSSQMSDNVIISGSTDRTLKVWNMETGICVHTLLGHTSTVRCMHLHGNKVVSGSRDATLRVWDILEGVCLRVLVGHLAAVRCVQYDGKLIVSGAYDYMVKIWHPDKSECLHTLQGHTNRVYSLQFDGVHVVSGSLDTSIRVWDVETGNCKHTLMGHQSLTSGMELRENILVSGNADSTVKVWDITTGQCLQTLSGPNKHQSAVTCLQFNSRFVVTSSDDGTVKLWDVKTGEFIRNLVSLDSGGSGGVVWRIRANDTKLICAVGSRNGTEETKLMVLDFDVEGACVKCS